MENLPLTSNIRKNDLPNKPSTSYQAVKQVLITNQVKIASFVVECECQFENNFIDIIFDTLSLQIIYF